jgi:hypothetical protein
MMDELAIEELSISRDPRKNGRSVSRRDAESNQRGEENTPTVLSKKPGTRNPKVVLA